MGSGSRPTVRGSGIRPPRRPIAAVRRGSLLLVFLLSGVAHGARPLVTDDARIVDGGACQLETWARLSAGGNEWWALPACNPTGRLELSAGVALLPEEPHGALDRVAVQLQGKYLLRGIGEGLPALAVVAGGLLDADRVPGADRVGSAYAYVPLTVATEDERFAVHLNAGWRWDGGADETVGTWGVAAEWFSRPAIGLLGELYGDALGDAYVQAGLRLWLVADRVQLDGTWGRRFVGGPAEDWASIGVRLLSPRLFAPIGL